MIQVIQTMSPIIILMITATLKICLTTILVILTITQVILVIRLMIVSDSDISKQNK